MDAGAVAVGDVQTPAERRRRDSVIDGFPGFLEITLLALVIEALAHG